MTSVLSPDAPTPGVDTKDNRAVMVPAAPAAAAYAASSLDKRPWVCVPSDDFVGTGRGFRRNFVDFYGFRMRQIGSTHGASEYKRKERNLALDNATVAAANANLSSSGTHLSSSSAIDYEELFEVGIQYGDYLGSLQQRTDAWVPVRHLMKPMTSTDDPASIDEAQLTSSHSAKRRFAIFSNVFHQWIGRGRPLLVHATVPAGTVPVPEPSWLSIEHQRTPQNLEEFVQAMSSQIYDKLRASKLSKTMLRDRGKDLKSSFQTGARRKQIVDIRVMSDDEIFDQTRSRIAQLREQAIGGAAGLHDTIIQKLDTSMTTNKSGTFEIIKLAQLLGFPHPTVDAAAEVARFVIRRLKAEIETLSRLESIADGRRASSLDMTDLAMPLSIFEIALASNMFGREFIRMTLDGTLKYEDEIKVEDKDKVMADSLNGKTLNSQQLQQDTKQPDSKRKDPDYHTRKLVEKYVSELNKLKLLNESLAGKFIRDEEYATVHKMDASTENDMVRGADRSNPQVNQHYEDALADLAAYEDEKRRETLRGASMTSYIDSINGDMWRNVDPADAWVSPTSMMQTREIAWHARKMMPVRDVIDEDGRLKRDESPRGRSKSVEELESEKRIADIRNAHGVKAGVQAYYYMSNAGDITFTEPRENETMETYVWARMKGDVPASMHHTGYNTPGGWTLFRNVNAQDHAGKKLSPMKKARDRASTASLSESEAKARFELGCVSPGGFEGNDKVDGYVSFDWAEAHPASELLRQNASHLQHLNLGLSGDGISVQIPAEPIQVTPGHPVFLAGNRVSIKFHPEDKMWDLKLRIERQEGIPATRQQLVTINKNNKVSKMDNTFLVKSYQTQILFLRVLPPARPYRAPAGTLHRIPEPRWRCEGLEGLQAGGSGMIWVPRGTDRKDVLTTIVDTFDEETVLARLHEFGKKARITNKVSELRKDLVKLMKGNVDTRGMMKS